MSISYDDNHYTMGTSIHTYHIIIMIWNANGFFQNLNLPCLNNNQHTSTTVYKCVSSDIYIYIYVKHIESNSRIDVITTHQYK